ncbi:hypothetical protein [Saccharothrix variisporea]|uniref:Uncharacterized protein n=1 Tax=Saccharothrix variisporea TaxID=543527 RepID=A0A495X9J0_9PSEU|nr:hypothetical protein [Saccharothrix variisporea]RKT69273.1 hypothetical protein DFJ66_2477 [Saccharothrix variisporea]
MTFMVCREAWSADIGYPCGDHTMTRAPGLRPSDPATPSPATDATDRALFLLAATFVVIATTDLVIGICITELWPYLVAALCGLAASALTWLRRRSRVDH